MLQLADNLIWMRLLKTVNNHSAPTRSSELLRNRYSALPLRFTRQRTRAEFRLRSDVDSPQAADLPFTRLTAAPLCSANRKLTRHSKPTRTSHPLRNRHSARRSCLSVTLPRRRKSTATPSSPPPNPPSPGCSECSAPCAPHAPRPA
jgi:hypothetical protein